MKKSVLWLPKAKHETPDVFSVHGLGISEAMPRGHVYRPKGMDSYLLMHFHDPVDIEVRGKMSKYPANTFVLWKPWDSHHFGCNKRIWRHSWLHCYGKNAIANAIHGGNIDWGEPLILSHSSSVEIYLSQIYTELISHTPPDLLSLQCLVTLWLRELCRATNESQKTSIPEIFLETRRHIESHFNEHIEIQFLANMTQLCLAHFITKFKRYFGFPPLQFQQNLKLNQAAYLLHDSNLSIIQVAEKVGMDDPFYFSKRFKKKFGLSPQYYRKNKAT